MNADIEVLAQFFAAINRNDMDAITRDFDPAIVRIEPEGFPSAGTYRGIAEVQEHVRKGRGTWAEGTCEPERFLVNGDKVVVYLHAWVRLHGKHEWTGGRFADGFVLRNRKITEYLSFGERQDALDWAGIEDTPAIRAMPEPALDPFDLQRFVDAQAVNYADALAELRAGRKTTHWSWYVIPQLAGLGTSPMARRYAIQSLDEAKAYLAHPLLGARLRECVAAMNGLDAGIMAEQVLGGIDARKFQSCLTLFDRAAGGAEPLFHAALDKFYGGQPDAASLRLLVSAAASPGSPAPP